MVQSAEEKKRAGGARAHRRVLHVAFVAVSELSGFLLGLAPSCGIEIWFGVRESFGKANSVTNFCRVFDCSSSSMRREPTRPTVGIFAGCKGVGGGCCGFIRQMQAKMRCTPTAPAHLALPAVHFSSHASIQRAAHTCLSYIHSRPTSRSPRPFPRRISLSVSHRHEAPADRQPTKSSSSRPSESRCKSRRRPSCSRPASSARTACPSRRPPREDEGADADADDHVARVLVEWHQSYPVIIERLNVLVSM